MASRNNVLVILALAILIAIAAIGTFILVRPPHVQSPSLTRLRAPASRPAERQLLEALHQPYALPPGQVARHIAPPFARARVDYMQPFYVLDWPPDFDPNHTRVLWLWDGKMLTWVSLTLQHTLFYAAFPDLWPHDFEQWDAVQDFFQNLPGDLVFDKKASSEERLLAFAALSPPARIQFQKKRVHRPVLLISREYAGPRGFTLDKQILVSDVPASAGRENVNDGPFTTFCDNLQKILHIPVINEATAPSGRLFWKVHDQHQRRDASRRATLYQHLSTQTGLQFREEHREAEIWSIVQ